MDESITNGERERSKIAGGPAWRVVLGGAVFVGWLLSGLQAEAQRTVSVRAGEAVGLLGVEEGRAIVDVALELVPPVELAPTEDAWDCSHVVHAIYESAGHAYPYAPSSDIYSGNGSFVRVRHPRAGDVIAWWGHLGIVLDPAQHSFYSLVRTGLKAQNYESAYWRSRGQPRFYRLRVATRPQVRRAKGQNPSATSMSGEDN
jgi:hypothetical protein